MFVSRQSSYETFHLKCDHHFTPAHGQGGGIGCRDHFHATPSSALSLSPLSLSLSLSLTHTHTHSLAFVRAKNTQRGVKCMQILNSNKSRSNLYRKYACT